jgi:CBS domain-containing protein
MQVDQSVQVSDVMTRDVVTVLPTDTLQQAAILMEHLNVGALPVCDGAKLVGLITDRDIVIRAVALGASPAKTRVLEVMSLHVESCREDETVEEVMERMGGMQIRRVPVIDSGKKLIGIVSLGDIATDRVPGVADTLEQISTPSHPERH